MMINLQSNMYSSQAAAAKRPVRLRLAIFSFALISLTQISGCADVIAGEAIPVAAVVLTPCEQAESDGTAAQEIGCRRMFTTAGPMAKHQTGNILAHDHMFVEFGDEQGGFDASAEEVNAIIGPLVIQAQELGYSVFVDPTPVGVNRRPDIIQYIAQKAGLPTVIATGIYHEPNIPQWAVDASVEEVSTWIQGELNDGIEETGVRAGFIKVSQSWGGITPLEEKILEAACDAAKATNASIGSHILEGAVAIDVIDRLEGFGCKANRFIWIHAPFTALTDSSDWLIQAAQRGAFISHDFMGSNFWAPYLDGDNDDETQIALLKEMIDAGFEDQLLIGQDSGWFDPKYDGGQEAGAFEIQGFNHIAEQFVPKLRNAGYKEPLIHKLLHENPWNAYSR